MDVWQTLASAEDSTEGSSASIPRRTVFSPRQDRSLASSSGSTAPRRRHRRRRRRLRGRVVAPDPGLRQSALFEGSAGGESSVSNNLVTPTVHDDVVSYTQRGTVSAARHAGASSIDRLSSLLMAPPSVPAPAQNGPGTAPDGAAASTRSAGGTLLGVSLGAGAAVALGFLLLRVWQNVRPNAPSSASRGGPREDNTNDVA